MLQAMPGVPSIAGFLLEKSDCLEAQDCGGVMSTIRFDSIRSDLPTSVSISRRDRIE